MNEREQKKWAYFVILSTTNNIVSFPIALGKPLMKSIAKLAHTFSGIGIGWSNPAGAKF